MRFSLRFLKDASDDIDNVLKHTFDHFGDEQLELYKRLIRAALADISTNPNSPKAKRRPELHRDARTFHIARRGGNARHFILFRFVDDRVIEVGRVLHDSMDLRRHLPEGFAAEDE